MPLKKKAVKPKATTTTKASAKSAVSQVVNVRVGTVPSTRKRRPAPRRAKPMMPEPSASPLLRQMPSINLSLSTQSYNQPQPNYLNEYNMLLRQMAEERNARARAAPPLAPNTAPLTINRQVNDLLSRVEPMPTAEAFPIAKVVNKETYDDPLSNENMFVNSSRLAENLAPKLPVSNFDYNDVNNYDEENAYEQEEMEQEVEKETAAKKTKSPSKKYYDEMSKAYEDYMNYLRDMNERYGINEAPKSRRTLNSKPQIKKEIERLQDIVMNVAPRKAGKG